MSTCAKNAEKAEQSERLLSLEFLVLFFQATCCNCYIAVFYCMEQWMARIDVMPGTRGLLLSVLACVVFLTRPVSTYYLYGRNKRRAMILSILTSSLTLLFYPAIQSSFAVPAIFCLRTIQGLALAVYSSCTVSLLVDCIPKGQSARGFALFSMTLLLPYAVIPAIGEELISLVGGEAQLFAWTALLGFPALLTLPLLTRILRAQVQPHRPQKETGTRSAMWASLRLSDLGLAYLACLTFSIMTNEAIFFIKGLCQLIDAVPAYFFTTYTSTIMLIRLAGNTLFDRLPRYPVIMGASLVLALVTSAMAYSSGKELILLSVLYGLSLGLLYPLLAAVICDRSSRELRSVNSNLMMAAFDISGVLAPIIGGFMVTTHLGYRGVFLSCSVSVALSGLCMLCDFFFQRQKR